MAQKEQELLLKEKSLQIRESDLLIREKLLDSTLLTDSGRQVNSAITGSWQVRMTCVEAGCKGSAVGDTKNENWEFMYQGRAIIVKAMSGDQLIRVYTGFYTGKTVELTEKRTDAAGEVNMVVRLHETQEGKMEGEREIVREDCKIIYDLKLVKNDE